MTITMTPTKRLTNDDKDLLIYCSHPGCTKEARWWSGLPKHIYEQVPYCFDHAQPLPWYMQRAILAKHDEVKARRTAQEQQDE